LKGFPKTIGTGNDLLNLLALVQAKELSAENLNDVIAKIEARGYIPCPILAVSDDRQTVTVTYCTEAQCSQEVGDGCTITAVSHETSEGGLDDVPDKTVITLSTALGETIAQLPIPSPFDPYDALGITQGTIDSIKGVLNQL
jgi:hypothetical protein